MLFRGVISCRSFCAAAESLVMLGFVFLFCSYSTHAQAGQATLAWNASTSSGVAGYYLFYGLSSGSYTSSLDVGNKTSYTLTGLQDGKKYYIACKAYNSGKTIWSGFSNEVSTAISTSSTTTTSSATLIASFSANPTSGVVPLTVNFADTSTGAISTRSWAFGDGSTSTATSGAKKYSTPGGYTMKLTVTGGGVTSIATKSITATAAATTSTGGESGTYTGLVAAYNFEEASGTTVVDASGKGNHGTISGATRIAQGKFGKALSFDGVNDWVTVNDTASLDLTTGMTLEAWVYPTVFTSYWRTILHKETDSYYLMAGSNLDTPAGGGTYTSGNQNVYAGSSLPVNTWTHLAVTYDSARVRLYVNGTEVASKLQTTPIKTSTSALRIGGTQTYGEFFKGRIDEIRVYNRALNADQIKNDLTRAVRQ